MVQLVVESSVSSNNLTALTSYLCGQTVKLGRTNTVSEMRNKMRWALKTLGFSMKLPIEHCCDGQLNPEQSWEELNTLGIDFHQALLFYNMHLLSWKPSDHKQVTALELAELKFLFGLCFKIGLPDSLVSIMLAQLKRAYYYSHDCIYWDFSVTRWKYSIPQNKIEQMDNPNAHYEDQVSVLNRPENPKRDLENYFEHEIYQLEFNNAINTSCSLRVSKPGDEIIELNPGDLVRFNVD